MALTNNSKFYVDERDIKITWQSIFSSVCTLYAGKIGHEEAVQTADKIWEDFMTRDNVQRIREKYIDNLPTDRKREILNELNAAERPSIRDINLRNKLQQDLDVSADVPRSTTPPPDAGEQPNG